jgi:acyl carrier protein
MNDQLITSLSDYISTTIIKNPSRKIRPDEPLLSSGLVDSFNLMDLALHIEDSYGVRIEDTELNAQSFDSLDQLATLIESRRPPHGDV